MYHSLHFCPKHFQLFLENYITVSKYNYTGTIVHYLGPKDWIMAHSYLLCENKYGTLTLRSCHRRDAWQGHDGLYYLISWPDNLWISTTNTTNFICQLERSHFYLSCKNIYPTLTLRSRHRRDACCEASRTRLDYYLISWPDNLWISTTNTTNFICQLERSHFYLSCRNNYPTLTLRSRHGRDACYGHDGLYFLIFWPDKLWIIITNTLNFLCQLERSHNHLLSKNNDPTLTVRSRHGCDASPQHIRANNATPIKRPWNKYQVVNCTLPFSGNQKWRLSPIYKKECIDI